MPAAGPTDQDLASVLDVVQRMDDGDDLTDNAGNSSALGLSLDIVAESMDTAK